MGYAGFCGNIFSRRFTVGGVESAAVGGGHTERIDVHGPQLIVSSDFPQVLVVRPSLGRFDPLYSARANPRSSGLMACAGPMS